MSLSDPIADMLTRIRSQDGRPHQEKHKDHQDCRCAEEEGYILGYDRTEDPRQDVLAFQIHAGRQSGDSGSGTAASPAGGCIAAAIAGC